MRKTLTASISFVLLLAAFTLTFSRTVRTQTAVLLLGSFSGSAKALSVTTDGYANVTIAAGAAGAPTNATYITQTANSTLSAEQALSALATGIVKNTTTTGVLSIATSADIPIPGADTQVLFNDGGALGADAGLTFDKATGAFSVSTGLTTLSGSGGSFDGAPGTLLLIADATGGQQALVLKDVSDVANVHTTQIQVNGNGQLTISADEATTGGSLAWQPTASPPHWSVGGPVVVNASVTATDFIVSGSSITPLRGVTSSIGGGLLSAGACTSGTAAVTGATTSMVALAMPATYPGDGASWEVYVSAADTVTVKVCGLVAVTPTASTYQVRVIP